MKQTRTSRKLRFGTEIERLIRVRAAVESMTPLAEDRFWLVGLLGDILNDIDVRDRFHMTVKGAPPDTKRQDKADWCALWIAWRTRPGAADRITVTAAKEQAIKAWGMTDDQVRHAWLKRSAEAREIAAAFGEEFALVLEEHRVRCRK